MRKQPRRQRAEDFSGEFEEKVLYINRCATVTKGGRKFSFSALILIGDGQGHVGYGFAKANEVSDAIRKGTEAARKNVFTIQMEGTTIPHEIYVEWDGARIVLKPASNGTGIVAGSKVRSVSTKLDFITSVKHLFQNINDFGRSLQSYTLWKHGVRLLVKNAT